MTDIRWTKASEADREFFRAVHHSAYREAIEAIFGWDEEVQDSFADSDFDQRNIHIIYTGETACGVIGWQEHDTSLELGPLYILPECQGQGIGSSIVMEFISKSRDNGHRLILKTLKSNLRAIALYERLGFVVTSTSDVYWHMDHLPLSDA